MGANFRPGLGFMPYGLEHVSIGDNFTCGERFKLRAFAEWMGGGYSPDIQIGSNVSIESDCHISAIGSVRIDDGVLMASFVYISDHAHGDDRFLDLDTPPLRRPLFSKGPVHICRNVWLGERVCVLPGVTIGEGSVIGAGSIVTHDIPPFSIAAGAPARVIKTITK